MANTPFQIQGTTLSIGGVELEAGTAGGVVIPGVTQISSYGVEEVNETDDQTYHGYPPNSEITVYDHVQKNGSWGDFPPVLANYKATTDDEGYIDEIQVIDGGSEYTSQEATDNAANDMWSFENVPTWAYTYASGSEFTAGTDVAFGGLFAYSNGMGGHNIIVNNAKWSNATKADNITSQTSPTLFTVYFVGHPEQAYLFSLLQQDGPGGDGLGGYSGRMQGTWLPSNLPLTDPQYIDIAEIRFGHVDPWRQIPFRPVMRAGVVETIGGGGTDTANFQFDAVGEGNNVMTISENGDNSYITLAPSGVEGQAYIRVPGDNYATDGLQIYNTGTNGNISINATNNVSLAADNNSVTLIASGNDWAFRPDGLMAFPDGCAKLGRAPYPTGSATFESITYVDNYADPIAAGMLDLDLEGNEYSYDDDKVYIDLPFNIKSFGRNISSITVSSNAYIAFEKEVFNADYIPQEDSPNGIRGMISEVPTPLLCIAGRDGGWQKVYTKSLSNPDRFVVRYEGTPDHISFNDTSTVKYNAVFYANSDQIDFYMVANTTDPKLTFITDSWSNLGGFDTSAETAYTIRTSPYLYDANGNIKIQNGGQIKADADEDLTLRISDTIDDGYELRLTVDDGINDLTRVSLDANEVTIYTDLQGPGYQWRFEGSAGQLRVPGAIYGYDQNVALYAMDTGSGTTYATLESRSHINDGVFSRIKAKTDGVVISTGLTTSDKNWGFGADGKLTLPNGDVIGAGPISAPSGNTTSITSYAYDATGTTVMLTTGDTVEFPNFSGIVTANCYTSGTVTQFLCGGGGGSGIVVGSSKPALETGTMTDNGPISGYTFTATETGEHCFYVVRTRTGG